MILFVADTDRASARGHAMLQQQIAPTALVIVDNEYVLRGELPPAFARHRVLRIGALPVFLKTYIDRLGFSFTTYLRRERIHRLNCINGSARTISVFASSS